MNDRPRTVAFELEPLSLPAFSIRHEIVDERVLVRLTGNADSEVTVAFAEYLERLHDQVVAPGVRSVVLDFRQLYFLPSACVKRLVVAVKRSMLLEA